MPTLCTVCRYPLRSPGRPAAAREKVTTRILVTWQLAGEMMDQSRGADPGSAGVPALTRSLSWPGLTVNAVGLILGAGIYAVLGAAAGIAGEGLWWSFLAAGAVAAITGLSYAELATMLPFAGAEYVYLREATPRHRMPATLVGAMLLVSGAATLATVALAFADYLAQLVAWPRPLIATLLMITLSGISLLGIRESSRINAAFTAVEALGLVLFAVVGALAPGFGEALLTPPGTGFLPAAALVFFAFLGFEGIANMAEEARRPATDIPRAIFAAIAVTTILYILVALAAVALLTPEQLGTSAAPLSTAAATVSPRVGGLLGGIALFATANTALVQMVVSSRTVLGMARGGDLPRILGRLLPRRRTPWVASLALLAGALALLPIGRIEVAGGVASLASLLAFAGVHVALIVLRFTQPERPRPFRVPGSLGRVPVLPAVGLLSVLLLLGQLERQVWMVGGACGGVVVGLRWMRAILARRRARASAAPQ